MSRSSTFLIALILTGCSTTEYWKHHSKPPSEFQRDQAFCLNNAITNVPNIAVPGQVTESRIQQPKSFDTTCSPGFGNINCRTTVNSGPVSAFERYQVSPQAQMNDAVQRTRAAYVETCLVKMGWLKIDAEVVNKAQQAEASRKASFDDAQKKLNNEIKQFTEKFCKSDKYLAVTSLAPCSIPEINALHLSNPDYMSRSQQILFADVSSENTKLNDSVINFFSGNIVTPELRSKLIELQTKKRESEITNDSNLMSLKITWGEYNRINKQISEDNKKEMELITRKR